MPKTKYRLSELGVGFPKKYTSKEVLCIDSVLTTGNAQGFNDGVSRADRLVELDEEQILRVINQSVLDSLDKGINPTMENVSKAIAQNLPRLIKEVTE